MVAQPKASRAPFELTVQQLCSAVRRCWWALAQAAFCVAGCALILIDVQVGGFLGSTSNGRFVSFMDSVNSLSDYRKQLPFDPPLPGDVVQCCTTEQPAHSRKSRYSLTDGHSFGMQLYILLAAFGSKYGSSTVASLLLQQTPVIMKGPRHVLSFLVAFGLVQGFDGIYQAVSEPGPSQFVVAVGAALYKVRKLTFVTLISATEGWLLPIVLAIVVLEGNSFLRSAENALSNYGLPRRRVTWLQLLSWLTKRTYKIIILTCVMVAWERYGTCEAIPGAEGTEHWVQRGLQVVALVWYFVPRFKLTSRGAQAFHVIFGLGRRTPRSGDARGPRKAKAE